jgi:predicted DNA-binding helix-hairpin-helix protein
MNYLQEKSILQDSLSINYEVQKQKYKSLTTLYEEQKKLHAIEKQMIVEKYELELDHKRKWRMATVLTGAGLLLFMSIAI